nr:chromate transporter [Halobaculum salinum]
MSETRATGGAEVYGGQSSPAKLVEIVRYFLFIGIVGFGGPLVHVAMTEDDLAGEDSRGWADEPVFVEGLAICNVLPGPASTQLGIFMGWIRAGNLGAITAGFFFMLPTFVLVAFFSWLYFAYRTLPAVVVAILGAPPRWRPSRSPTPSPSRSRP